jgi:AcrR family transcriptional regulator
VEAQRADRHPKKNAILQEAISELNMKSVGEFRISLVLEAANASYSSLYHHFGDREGLIRTANTERFIASLRSDFSALGEAALRATTTTEFFASVAQQIFEEANNPRARQGRHERIQALAYALTDGEALERIIDVQRAHIARLVEVFSRVQDRNLIRKDLNLESYVAWFMGMQLGHVLLELDDEVGPSSSSWDRCAILGALQPLTRDHEPLHWSSSWEHTPEKEWRQPWIELSDEPLKTSEHPTAQALIGNTIRLLEMGGENAVKLPLVLEGTDTSVTSIYHFFGDRSGLIAAAHAARFVQRSPAVIVDYRAAMAHARSADDLFAFLRLILISHANDEAVIRWRWSRVEVLGAALQQPALLASVVRNQRLVTEQFASISDSAQENGFIEPGLDTKATALWFQGMQTGKVLTEIQPGLDKNEEWIDLAIEGVDAALRVSPD